MSNTRTKARPSLREQARAAAYRTDHYDIPLVPYDEAQAVAKALAEAKAKAQAERLYGIDVKAAEAAQAKAQAAYDRCFRRVTFRGLPPTEIDTLANEHPDPAEGEDPPEGHVPQVYHLAVASCVDGEDMTATDWQDVCENVWSAPESLAFRQAVWSANSQTFAAGIPKG